MTTRPSEGFSRVCTKIRLDTKLVCRLADDADIVATYSAKQLRRGGLRGGSGKSLRSPPKSSAKITHLGDTLVTYPCYAALVACNGIEQVSTPRGRGRIDETGTTSTCGSGGSLGVSCRAGLGGDVQLYWPLRGHPRGRHDDRLSHPRSNS